MNEDKKTADYTRKAIDKYKTTKDIFTVTLPKGTRDKIRAKHGNIAFNEYFKMLVDNDLKEDNKSDFPF